MSETALKAPLMHPLKFWLPHHHARVLIAQNYTNLSLVALDILKDMPRPTVQVCGSLSSGDRSIEENMKIFAAAIEHLCWDYYVFNQLPFEEKIQRMIGDRQENGYPWDLFDEFYLPIFQSGRIEILFFLRGWEKSVGADWEHEKAKFLKIPIRYLDDNFQIHLMPLN
jgi:hypothetical protein